VRRGRQHPLLELELEIDDDEVLCVEERWRPHRRNHSLV
jgi:hypothetical protein